MIWMIMTGAWAAEPPGDVGQVLGQLAAKYGPVDVIRADFVQTTASTYGDTVQKGTVILKRPGKIRWEAAPEGKQFVCDGSTLWIYEPAEKQVIRIRDFGKQAASAYSVLQSMDKLSEMFDVALAGGDAAAGWDLVLRPKSGQEAQFKKLVIELDRELLLDVVRITDPFDTVTVLDFGGVQLGGTAPDTLFAFAVPAGVRVVDAGN